MDHINGSLGWVASPDALGWAWLRRTWRLLSFWMLQRIAVGHQLAHAHNPRRFSAAQARREIRDVLQLLQQRRGGPSLSQRCQRMPTDSYQRTAPKTTHAWPRKKNDKPPKPPNIKPASAAEIAKANNLTSNSYNFSKRRWVAPGRMDVWKIPHSSRFRP